MLQALHPPRDSRRFDGYFLGKSGVPVPPKEACPEPVGEEGDLVYYVNGVDTDISKQMEDMRRIAKHGRCRVLGIHNATAGLVRDLGECLGDKLGMGENLAVASVKELLRHSLESGLQVSLVGHSQGALICSRALRETGSELLSNVHLETAGGASYTYPEGPRYTHRVNRYDPVPLLFGISALPVEGREDFVRFEPPCRKESESLSDFLMKLMDRTVHGTEIYYGES